MKGKPPLIGRDRVQDDFKTLVDRHIRKHRRDERRLAEQRTTRHRLEARKSCVVDARRYRILRKFPLSAAAKLDWKTLIPARGLNISGSIWLQKFRDASYSGFAKAVAYSIRNGLVPSYLNAKAITPANKNTGQEAAATTIRKTTSSDK